MTADEARGMTKGVYERIETRIDEVEQDIRETAVKGGRSIEKNYGGDYMTNNEIAEYFRKQGFVVEHIVSPWESLIIRW